MARVRATLLADAAVWGEATVALLPLPFLPFDLVTKVQGQDWVVPFSAALPFLDLETGARPVKGKVQVQPPEFPSWEVWAGYGIPFTFPWKSHCGAQGELLSCREGSEVIRRDVTGQAIHEHIPRGSLQGFCQLESLIPRGQGGWTSITQNAKVYVRGLFPFAGNLVAPPGHQDGAGFSARFKEPFGIVLVQPYPRRDGYTGHHYPAHFVVADRQDHVLRTVTMDGKVATLCGQPGKAGHRDSPSWLERMGSWATRRPLDPPLFNAPTHVAVYYPNQPILVADSGNHVIRTISQDGTVGTLAGTPGQAGYQDSPDPARAAFNDPQGIAMDPGTGRVYVADRGNRVIRIIYRGGQVSTLAGDPEARASRDGRGPLAGFTDLKGLHVDRVLGGEYLLYALDGHAVRSIRLSDGNVTTLLGVVDQPGWEDFREGSWEVRARLARRPCLNDPTGILCFPGGFHIADHGNHAVRTYLFDHKLTTWAGGPDLGGATRWGLPRDFLTVPLDENYAALEGPRTLAWSGLSDTCQHAEHLALTSGSGLARLQYAHNILDTLVIRDLEVAREAAGGPVVVRFALAALTPWERQVRRPVHYTVDFMSPDGKVDTRIRGRSAGGETVVVLGDPPWEGSGTVVVRCVTDEGWSAGAKGYLPAS